MNEPKRPICPYCPEGVEMTLRLTKYSDGTIAAAYYECPVCGADSPYIEDNIGDGIESAAYEAAMKRYVEPNRVLTLEELGGMDSERSIYFETRESGPYSGAVFESSVLSAKETFCDEDESADAKREYGICVRCWLRRPTDAERQSMAWEEPNEREAAD